MKQIIFLILIALFIATPVHGAFTDQDADRINATLNNTQTIIDLINQLEGMPTVQTGSTPYTFGQDFEPFVKLTDSNGEGIMNATCFIDIRRPTSNNSELFTSGQLIFLNGSNGMYLNNFTPDVNISGVWKADISCAEEVFGLNATRFLSENGVGLTISNVSEGASTRDIGLTPDAIETEICFPNRFNNFNPKGPLAEVKFMKEIREVSMFLNSEAAGPSKNYSVILRFFRISPVGEALLGTSILENQEIPSSITRFDFSDAVINKAFDTDTDIGEMEVCAIAHTSSATGRELTLSFNTSTENSSFVIESISVNATPTNFFIGDAATLKLDEPPTTASETLKSSANLIPIAFAFLGLVAAYISFNMNEKFKAISVLLIISSLSMLALGGTSIIHISDISGNSQLSALGNSSFLIFTTVLLLSLFFLFLDLFLKTMETFLSNKDTIRNALKKRNKNKFKT